MASWQGRRTDRGGANPDLVQVLGGVPAFAGCGPRELRRIADLGTEVRCRAGAVLVRGGAPLRQALVVLEGVITERPASGRERVVSIGHLTGEEGLARSHARARASSEACTDVRVLVFGPFELAEVASIVATVRRPAPAVAERRGRRAVREPAWAGPGPALA